MQNTQPKAPDIEEAVLGALMIESKAYLRVADVLSPNHFYQPDFRAVFDAIQSLSLKNQPIDLLTVINELRSQGTLETAGGAGKVSELTNKTGSTANLEYHCRILQETYIKRQLIETGQSLQKQGLEDTEDVFDILTTAEQTIYQLSNPILGSPAKPVGDHVHEVIKEIESAQNQELLGVPSFNIDLDRVTCGYRNGDLNILAARPGSGKTAKALQEALQQAMNGYPVAYFSLEMKQNLLIKRAFSNLASVDTMRVNTGYLDKDEWQRINQATEQLDNCPLWIDDEGNLNYLTLKSKLRKLKEQGLRAAYVDYLQLMEPMRRHGTREQEISEISRGLKACATELDIPIVALSQLSREVDKREVPIPKLSDLRESGSLEQDSSVVIFLYWPKAYGREEEPENLLHLIASKNRHGMVKDVGVIFNEQYQQFFDYDGKAEDDTPF